MEAGGTMAAWRAAFLSGIDSQLRHVGTMAAILSGKPALAGWEAARLHSCAFKNSVLWRY